MKKKSTHTFFKIEYFIVSILIVWVGYFVYQYKGSDNVSLVENAGSKSEIDFLPPPNALDHYKWKSNSPYTVVNYFSMDCPNCREVDATEEKYKTIYEKSFSLIYRHSPLPSQPLSGEKAVIAECVYQQSGNEGMFAFISDSYANYRSFAKDNKWVIDIAKKYVQDSSSLGNCFSSSEMKAFINNKKIEAVSQGVEGTPTIGVFKGDVLMFRVTIGGKGVKRIMDYLASEVK